MSNEILYMEWKSFNLPRAIMFGYEPDALDWLINTVSPIHKHTENRFTKRYSNKSFSATMRDSEGKCARFADICFSHHRWWDTVYIPVTEEEEAKAWGEAHRWDGTPYDLVGAMGLASDHKILKPSESKVFCNEVCGYVVNAAKGDCFFGHRPDSITPTEADFLMRTMFDKMGLKAKGVA